MSGSGSDNDAGSDSPLDDAPAEEWAHRDLIQGLRTYYRKQPPEAVMAQHLAELQRQQHLQRAPVESRRLTQSVAVAVIALCAVAAFLFALGDDPGIVAIDVSDNSPTVPFTATESQPVTNDLGSVLSQTASTTTTNLLSPSTASSGTAVNQPATNTDSTADESTTTATTSTTSPSISEEISSVTHDTLTTTTTSAEMTCAGLGATLVGTEGDDVLVGTNGPDVIVGLGGDDTIDGLAGDDTICGGNGKDELNGGEGDDYLYGGNGKDVLIGGPGYDQFDGGNGEDVIIQDNP